MLTMADRASKRSKPSPADDAAPVSRKLANNARARDCRSQKSRTASAFTYDDSDLTTITGMSIETKGTRLVSTQTIITVEPPPIMPAMFPSIIADWDVDPVNIPPSDYFGVPLVTAPASVPLTLSEPVS
jgi:hypothetical protein